MDADIAVILQSVPRDLAEELSKKFIVDYKGKEKDQFSADIAIRYSSEPIVVNDLSTVIFTFLSEISAFAEVIKSLRGVLRIGVFYNLNETVVFPFYLSLGSVKIIENFGLAIDVSGYPCNDDSEEGS